MFPMKAKDTIPIWALVLIAVIFPVLTIALVALGVRRSPYDFHNGILGLLLSILLTTIFTQVIKVKGRKGSTKKNKKKRKRRVTAKVVTLAKFVDANGGVMSRIFPFFRLR